jgi:hypothetical protein
LAEAVLKGAGFSPVKVKLARQSDGGFGGIIRRDAGTKHDIQLPGVGGENPDRRNAGMSRNREAVGWRFFAAFFRKKYYPVLDVPASHRECIGRDTLAAVCRYNNLDVFFYNNLACLAGY